MTIDPDRGAISGMMRGVPVLTLGAGYVGSAAFGAALIFCAFDTRASKIACLATLPVWALVSWFGTTWCVGLRITWERELTMAAQVTHQDPTSRRDHGGLLVQYVLSLSCYLATR